MFDRRNIHWPFELIIGLVGDPDPLDVDRAIEELSAAHDGLKVLHDRESASLLIGGCSEDELEDSLSLLRSKVHCDPLVGTPQAGFRETVGESAEADYVHGRQEDTAGPFARVRLSVEPLVDSYAVIFENKADPGEIPEQYIPAIERGVECVLNEGILIGCAMIGVKVTLLGGAHRDPGSSVMAFELAAREALRQAIQRAYPIVVEPILAVEVITPEAHVGVVTGDLMSRRGAVTSMDARDTKKTIEALVPATFMHGYSGNLRQMTADTGSVTMLFSHYERVRRPADDGPWDEPVSAALRP